jgi:hypothetical protein
MAKKKSSDYIFGRITGASIMLAFLACKDFELVVSNTGSVKE